MNSKETTAEKPQMAQQLNEYIQGCREELTKVSRPTRQETIQISIVTVILMVAIALSLGLIDMVFSAIMTQILS